MPRVAFYRNTNTVTSTQKNGLESGRVDWLQGLDFRISELVYYLNDALFNTLSETVTLQASDATFNRIDVFYADDSGNVGVLTGQSSLNPVKPEINPLSQIELTFVIIEANATEPQGVSSESVYKENEGDPNEWNTASSSSAITFNNTTDPATDINAIAIENYSNFDTCSFTKGSTVSTISFNYLRFKVKNGLGQIGFLIQAYNGSTLVSGEFSVIFKDGTYGYTSQNTTEYQEIIIPKEDFQFTNTEFDRIDFKLLEVVSSPSVSTHYIDDIVLGFGMSDNDDTICGCSLGEYETESDLENSHPSPTNGSTAIINPIDNDPYSAYWDSNSNPPSWKYGNGIVQMDNVSPFLQLTYAPVVLWDQESSIFPKAKIDAIGNFEIQLSNVNEIASGSLKILKSSTSDIIMSFDNNNQHYESNKTGVLSSISLTGDSGSIYMIPFIVDGTSVFWDIPTVTVLSTDPTDPVIPPQTSFTFNRLIDVEGVSFDLVDTSNFVIVSGESEFKFVNKDTEGVTVYPLGFVAGIRGVLASESEGVFFLLMIDSVSGFSRIQVRSLASPATIHQDISDTVLGLSGHYDQVSNKLYCAIVGGVRIYTFDSGTNTLSVEATIDMPSLTCIDISIDSGKMFVLASDSGDYSCRVYEIVSGTPYVYNFLESITPFLNSTIRALYYSSTQGLFFSHGNTTNAITRHDPVTYVYADDIIIPNVNRPFGFFVKANEMWIANLGDNNIIKAI